MIDELIATHCSPALVGIKASNIVSCCKQRYENINLIIELLNKNMNSLGIFFEKLCECRNRALIMVYRKDVLSNYLKKKEINQFLIDYGYPEEFEVESYINYLKMRINRNDEFPHEIGAFLGYPIEDIRGFINHPNEGCLYIGCWKVYKDANKKIQIFNSYNICKEKILQQINLGKSLYEIFSAA